jgi:hypothetical protein
MSICKDDTCGRWRAPGPHIYKPGRPGSIRVGSFNVTRVAIAVKAVLSRCGHMLEVTALHGHPVDIL